MMKRLLVITLVVAVVFGACEPDNGSPSASQVEAPTLQRQRQPLALPATVIVATDVDSAGYAVGGTSSSSGVGPDGAATFTIPLWVPEGRAGVQPSLSLSYSSSDRLSIDGQINPRWSRDWLIWLDGKRLGSFRRTQWDTALNLNWFPKARHELRAKLQWFAIDAHAGKAYRIDPRGHLLRDGAADDFSVNNFGLQLRYR